jgi:hypothetical protein
MNSLSINSHVRNNWKIYSAFFVGFFTYPIFMNFMRFCTNVNNKFLINYQCSFKLNFLKTKSYVLLFNCDNLFFQIISEELAKRGMNLIFIGRNYNNMNNQYNMLRRRYKQIDIMTIDRNIDDPSESVEICRKIENKDIGCIFFLK